MHCTYCFYEDVSESRQEKHLGLMTLDTARTLIGRVFAQPRRLVTFAFQGGEPTLSGLPFFVDFTAMVEEVKPSDTQVNYALQTNGLALDGSWAAFFAQHNFLVGVSIDGTAQLHDAMRPDRAGKGTYRRVCANLDLLQRHNVQYNVLCVVNGQVARRGQKVYQNLKALGCRHLQFIPCLDPLEGDRGGAFYSLTPERYGKFLCSVFDLWYRDLTEGNYVSVRLFDDYVHMLCGDPPSTCATSGQCGQYFVVEGDGGVYPCDFYVLDHWHLGSIHDHTLEELAESETAKTFLQESHKLPERCQSCPYLAICRGGCKRDRYLDLGALENYYCPAFTQFFAYALPRLQEAARREVRLRQAMQSGQLHPR